MFEVSPNIELLARAIDVCALRQAVYSANIANANVEGYRRLEVVFDRQALSRNAVMTGSGPDATRPWADGAQPHVVASADATVKLDEEMARMARNALRYQTLLAAYERSSGLVKMAAHEGRGG